VIQLVSTRFGNIEVDDSKAIVFRQGLIGFPDARRYVLIYPGGRGKVAWLQSIEVTGLAFPVVDGAMLGDNYPEPSAAHLAHEAGIGGTDLAVLVVVAVQKDVGLIANMLAPLVIDLETRLGVQIVLDPQKYSASAKLSPAAYTPPTAATASAAQ
jgi:flagellar assembly factor FliW